MEKKFEVQSPGKIYYSPEYDTLMSFISYFYQVDITKRLNPKRILEVGIGNKTISNYLKQCGFKVVTCDFSRDLEPDYVADIRALPFEDNSFDVVLAYEILEHLPWDDVDKALGEIHRVTKKYANISIPYSAHSFEILVAFPGVVKFFKQPFTNFFFRIPWPLKEIKGKNLSNHYWEVGRRGCPIRKVRCLLERRFKILKEVRPVMRSYHHFFVLEKR